MRIEWDPRAVQDLEEIRAFIAADKPAAPSRVAAHIKTTIGRLSEFPRMGRQTSEPNIRILPITRTPYVVYYHLLPDVVEILAVYHGARRRFPIDPARMRRSLATPTQCDNLLNVVE